MMMEKRVETHTPSNQTMEKRKKPIPGKFHWLPVSLHKEVRGILGSDWDQSKLIGCMDYYIRNVPDGSLLSKKMQNPKITHCIKSMPGIMYLFKCLNAKFGPTPAYLDRMVKILQLYLDHELKASIQGIIYYVDIANKIFLQMDVHLKGQDPGYILSVFLTARRSQHKTHRLVLDLLYTRYLTVQKWSVQKVELTDRLMLMYVIAYKQWVNLFLDDKPKVLEIMKNFTMFKPRHTFTENPKIPQSLREIFSQTGLVQELLTTSEKVDVLKQALLQYLDDDGHGTEDFSMSDVPEMAALSIGESQSGEKGDSQASTSTSEIESVLLSRPQEPKSVVPVPLMQTRMQRVVKEEEPETLAVIDLTEDELREKSMSWLQNLARRARDAQEVVIGGNLLPREMDVICLSDSDDADEGGNHQESVVDVVQDVVEGHVGESVDNETHVNLNVDEVNMMQWSEGANSESTSSVMAKNREMLDSITSNLDEVPVNHKLPPVQMVEKGTLNIGGLNSGKSAIKFGVRDDLVGSSPRKVTTAENVGENQGICQQQQQHHQQQQQQQQSTVVGQMVGGESVEEDSQNSEENYNIFNEIRMMERGGENFEAPPPQSAIFQDHANYFCEDFCPPDPKVLDRHRRRQSTEQTENIVYSVQRRPLANNEVGEVISSSGGSSQGTSERVLFSMAKPTQLPMEESLNNIVRDIMADFSDVDDVMPEEEDGSMDDEPEIESPSMETIEKADLVEFMEICERRNQSPEHLKSILDRSTPQEKSAKVKKKVKFGIAEYLEPDDYPRERDFFGGMSPRKAILKSSLKRSMQPGMVAVSSSSTSSSSSISASASVQKRLSVKESIKSPSNIMVKMTYVSPQMLQHQQTSVKGVVASVDSDARSTDSETDIEAPRIPVVQPKITPKRTQFLIRREFEDHRRKIKRRNSIACINYGEREENRIPEKVEQHHEKLELPQEKNVLPVLSEEIQQPKKPVLVENPELTEKLEQSEKPPAVNEKPLQLEKETSTDLPSTVIPTEKVEVKVKASPSIDPKLYRAYVPVTKLILPTTEAGKVKAAKTAEKKVAKRNVQIPAHVNLSQEMRQRSRVDYSLYTELTPSRMTRSMRRKFLELNLQDEDFLRAETTEKMAKNKLRRRLLSTFELVSESRASEEESEMKFNVVPPNVVRNPSSDQVPSSLSNSAMIKDKSKTVDKMRNSLKRKSIEEIQKVPVKIFGISPKEPPRAQSTPIVSLVNVEQSLPITKASRKEVLAPTTKFTPVRPQLDNKKIPMERSLKVPTVKSATPVPGMSRRNLVPLSRATLMIIGRDRKLSHMRAIVRVRKLFSDNVQKIGKRKKKNSSKKLIFLNERRQFFPEKTSESKLMNKKNNKALSPSPLLRVKNSESSVGHSQDSCEVSTKIACDPKEKPELSETSKDHKNGNAENPGESNQDVSANEDEDGKGKNAKRGRRSEGKRNKTPQRLKRSSLYQKIIEDTEVLGQIEIKPLAMLSMNEEIGKMASPDSTSSHGEANKVVEDQFKGKSVSPEYVNSTISSTVNTEISSTTQIAAKSVEKGDKASSSSRTKSPSPVDQKIHRLGFNGPVLRSMSSMINSNSSPISCDSQGNLGEDGDSQEKSPSRGESKCDSQTEEKSPENIQETSNTSDEGKIDEVPEVSEEQKSKESPVRCDSQGNADADQEGRQLEESEENGENEENVKNEENEENEEKSQEEEEILTKSFEEEKEEERTETVDESEVPVAATQATVHSNEEDANKVDDDKADDKDLSDATIDFQDFDTVSEYSNIDSPSSVCDDVNEEKVEDSDDDTATEANFMMHFDPSEAFKDTSEDESQQEESEIHEKDNLFENISSIESTEQNYLVDNCGLLTGETEAVEKIASPDSSNVQGKGCGECQENHLETLPDTSVNFMPNSEHGNGELGMNEQQEYVEHDGLFSSPIYDPEPMEVPQEDQPSKFNGQMTDQLMYQSVCDSSVNIERNLAIENLVEEMPSDDTTLITESDIFEEYCENLTSIGDNVTVETENEIVTEPFAVSNTFLTTPVTFPSVVSEVTTPTRKSDRQRIKSHTNLYVEHDYSPKTDTNRITPTSSTKTGDRYLLPPKSERISRRRSYHGDGRERRKNRQKLNTHGYVVGGIPQMLNQTLPPLKTSGPSSAIPEKSRVRVISEQIIPPSSSVSSYLEVHNNLQQQIEKNIPQVMPLPPPPPPPPPMTNGEALRKVRKPSRVIQTPPPTIPHYEQISPCPQEAKIKAFNMIPSSQSIAALASVAQRRPSKDTSGQVFAQGIGEYQIVQYTTNAPITPNPTDFCIITAARQPTPLPTIQTTFPNSAVGGQRLTGQSDELPQFVVSESDLVGDCL